MPPLLPRRSVLYMPGSNARALEKARTLDADCFIFDLEDAVAPDAKDVARDQVEDAVRRGGYADREIIVRVNGLDTPWGTDDIARLASCGASAILVPKVSSGEDIHRFADALNAAGRSNQTQLWAMIETPGSVLSPEPIAATARAPGVGLTCLVLGTNDLARDTRARLVPGRAPMLPWLMAVVAAARLHGIDIIDGVYNDLADPDGFHEECVQALNCGMDGKTLIHPKQIDVANAAFAPTLDEIRFAETVIEAFERPENASVGALRVEGKMVERLHAEMARRTIAVARAIADR